MRDARRRAAELMFDPDAYTGAHVNWYLGGDASLSAHQDTEPSSLRGMPIFSYSFLADGPNYRYFVISRDRGQKEKVACIPMGHGDLVAMAGHRFQRDLWHGVPPTTRGEFATQRRINVTARGWGGAAAISE